jgi:transposase
VRRFEDRAELPFRRMESPPGREAQVDFGKGAPVIGEDGKRTRPHLFRMVLSHSRAGYSEVVRKQGTEMFIWRIESAFLHFGGVTENLVVDNLKAAVTEADWHDPDIHPQIRELVVHELHCVEVILHQDRVGDYLATSRRVCLPHVGGNRLDPRPASFQLA